MTPQEDLQGVADVLGTVCLDSSAHPPSQQAGFGLVITSPSPSHGAGHREKVASHQCSRGVQRLAQGPESGGLLDLRLLSRFYGGHRLPWH